MFFMSLVFAFFAFTLAGHFFPEKKWTWIVAPIVMFVYTYLTCYFMIPLMGLIFIVLLIGSILCIYIDHFIKKRK